MYVPAFRVDTCFLVYSCVSVACFIINIDMFFILRSHSKKKQSRHNDRPNSQNIPGYGLLVSNTICWLSNYLVTDGPTVESNSFLTFQLPAGGPHQSSGPSTQPGRRERSRSRSPKRNGTDHHSSHHSDSKVYHRPASPQRERYQRQKTHRSK